MRSLRYIATYKFSWIKNIKVCVIVYLLLAILLLQNYLVFTSMNFLLGILVLTRGLSTNSNTKGNNRYAWISITFMALTILMPVNTLLYFSICAALLFFVEKAIGRINFLVPLTMILMSPIFKYLVNTFSFPIRLCLSSLAGQIFNFLGEQVTVAGNMIIRQRNEFSVDPACMGLQMLEASLMLGVLLLIYYQHLFRKKIRPGLAIAYLLLLVLLNAIWNLLRIIFIVKFNILPGTFSHEFVGIAGLLIYVFVPASWVARKLVQKFPPITNTSSSPSLTLKQCVPHLILVLCIGLLGARVATKDTYSAFNQLPSSKSGEFTISVYSPGILKLQSDRSLIYLKFSRGFFDSDHHPLLCWTGSGYSFQYIRKRNIAQREIYTAEIIKDNVTLYTSWWFDNGTKQTINPVQWRWDRLCGGGNYAIVNITCADRNTLEREVEKVFLKHSLNALIINSDKTQYK